MFGGLAVLSAIAHVISVSGFVRGFLRSFEHVDDTTINTDLDFDFHSPPYTPLPMARQ